jgi:hypothetical protein
MIDIRFGEPAWIDTVLTRIVSKIVAANVLASDLVGIYEGDIKDILGKPPGDRVVVVAPMSLPVFQGTTTGGGRTHTTTAGTVRVDVLRRVGGDQEFRSGRLLTSSAGLSPFVKQIIDAMQLETLAEEVDTISSTPLVEPMRLLSCEFISRVPQPGWSWCRTLWSVKFRTSFGA